MALGLGVQLDRDRDRAALRHAVARLRETDGDLGVVVVADRHLRRARHSRDDPVGQVAEAQLHALVVVVHRVLCGGEAECLPCLGRIEGDAGRHARVVATGRAVLVGPGDRDLHRAFGIGVQLDRDRDRTALPDPVARQREADRHLRVIVVVDLDRRRVRRPGEDPLGQGAEAQLHALVVVVHRVPVWRRS